MGKYGKIIYYVMKLKVYLKVYFFGELIELHGGVYLIRSDTIEMMDFHGFSSKTRLITGGYDHTFGHRVGPMDSKFGPWVSRTILRSHPG